MLMSFMLAPALQQPDLCRNRSGGASSGSRYRHSCTHLGEEANTEVARHYVQPYQIELLQHCQRVLCMTAADERNSILRFCRSRANIR